MFSCLIAICFRMKMLHNRSNNDTKMKKMFPSSTPKAIAIGSVPEPRTPKGAIGELLWKRFKKFLWRNGFSAVWNWHIFRGFLHIAKFIPRHHLSPRRLYSFEEEVSLHSLRLEVWEITLS